VSNKVSDVFDAQGSGYPLTVAIVTRHHEKCNTIRLMANGYCFLKKTLVGRGKKSDNNMQRTPK
jgi:hypothetical protein